MHERSAVKNSFSTYVWSKVDSCFCEFLYLNFNSALVRSLFERTVENLEHCAQAFLLFRLATRCRQKLQQSLFQIDVALSQMHLPHVVLKK